MKKGNNLTFILIILLTVICGGCHNSSVESNLIHHTMTAFTSEDFKGRLTGTQGNDKAVKYLSNALEDIGLDPYERNSYFHNYNQKVYHPEKQEHSFSIFFKDDTVKNYNYGQDYMDFYTTDYSLKFPVTLDPNDKDLKNKIIVLEGNSNLNNYKGKVKGILIRKDDFFNNINTVKARTPVIQINDKLYEALKDDQVKNITIKAKYNSDKIEASNVIGTISGKNNSKALVLSAHFDHVGWSGDKIFQGAIDNASGVSVLLDLAERLKAYSTNHSFDMDILICFFNGEESGLNGSKAFVEEIENRYDELYNINIDCVGMNDGSDLIIENDINTSYKLVKKLSDEFNKHDINMAKGQAISESDHLSFIEHDICAVNIGQMNIFKEGQSIHTTRDTIEWVDFDYLHKVSDALYYFILSNNGEIYEIDKANIMKNEEVDIYSDMELLNELIELQREENLEYNQGKIIKYKDLFFEITGTPDFATLESVKKYYSKITLPLDIDNYTLGSIKILEKGYLFGIKKIEVQDLSALNVGQVYERKVSTDYIRSISVRYQNMSETFDIEVSKKHQSNNCINRDYNLIPVIINGEEFSLLEVKDKKLILGIYKQIEVGDNKHHVIVYYYGENQKQINGIYYPDNKVEDIINLIKQIDLVKIVEGLNL